MKKIFAVLTVFAVALSLCACAGDTENEPVTSGDGGPAVVDGTDEPGVTEPEADEPEVTESEATATEPEPMGRGAKPPIMEPEIQPFDEETTALANEIINGLNDDMVLVQSILHLRQMEASAMSNGVDLYGNIIYLEITDSDGVTVTNPFVPFLEPYDTVDKCMEIIRRVYTDEHSEQLYTYYFAVHHAIEEVDGKLYGTLADYVDFWFDLPVQNAVRVSDDEIIAITTITYLDVENPYYYEITLKNENGEWKADGRFIVDYYGEGTWYEEDC